MLQLKGLEFFNDDASDAHVLYLSVHTEGGSGKAGGQTGLDELFRMVFQRYKEAGLLLEVGGQGGTRCC